MWQVSWVPINCIGGAIDWRSLTSSSASSSHLVGILLLTLAFIFLRIVHFSFRKLLISGPPLHARSTSFGDHVIANDVKVHNVKVHFP